MAPLTRPGYPDTCVRFRVPAADTSHLGRISCAVSAADGGLVPHRFSPGEKAAEIAPEAEVHIIAGIVLTRRTPSWIFHYYFRIPGLQYVYGHMVFS